MRCKKQSLRAAVREAAKEKGKRLTPAERAAVKTMLGISPKFVCGGPKPT